VRITKLEDLLPLIAKLPEARRRAIVEGFRDSGARAAARINAALEEDERLHPRREGSTPSPSPARGSKYGNKLVEHEGELFHSVGELRRFIDLQHEQRAGLIKNLQRQVEFPCAVAGVVVCSYFADFTYTTKEGVHVVEDFKGFRTEVYRLKKRMVEAIYKIKILETGAKTKSSLKVSSKHGGRRKKKARK
jgi:uncharacterized protein DUF1064